MTAIEVGVSTSTLSTGAVVPIEQLEVPRDLLQRVAENRPYVRATSNGCDLTAAHTIFAAVVADAFTTVELAADAGSRVTVAVPGWWSPVTRDRVRIALEQAGVHAQLVHEAEAAVAGWRLAGHELPDNIAALSLRAEHVSVAIVRECNGRPQALLSPVLVHEEGGAALDTAVLQHLVAGLSDLGETVDVSDPRTIAAARDALAQCGALREKLSVTATESVLLELPGVAQSVRVVRSEIEEIVTPWADAVLQMLGSAIEQSDLPVNAVLLTGGLASMPLMSQRISADYSLGALVPADPTFIVVQGAEQLAAGEDKPAHQWWKSLRSKISRPRKPAVDLSRQGVRRSPTAQFPMRLGSSPTAEQKPNGDVHNAEFEALLSSLRREEPGRASDVPATERLVTQ